MSAPPSGSVASSAVRPAPTGTSCAVLVGAGVKAGGCAGAGTVIVSCVVPVAPSGSVTVTVAV